MIVISCDPGLDRVSLALFSGDKLPRPEHAGPVDKLRAFDIVKAIETPADLALTERAWRIQQWVRAELRHYQPERFVLELPRVSGLYARHADESGKTGGAINNSLLQTHIASGIILGAATAVLGGWGRVLTVKARGTKKEVRLQELRQMFLSIGRKPPTRNKDDLDAIDIGIWADWPGRPDNG